ncbi:DUF805 domain-containing protein [Flexibacterium corallicola]|uniref:DUF805 domain-containing protein n=1 Tax=Flexibacterium corallicola TaxID=3037259 RepID=UPI00286F7CE1|nr:DUF805 domain-containing protein [Pseudovibrio sp. M1P-2-3]
MGKPIFEDMFSFSGRRNRMSYFLYSLAILIVPLFVVFVGGMLLGGLGVMFESLVDTGGIFFVVVFLPLFVILFAIAVSSIAVQTQRVRDFGWSGWTVLITLIPYVGWLFSLAILLVPGTEGENRYGPSPKEL